MIYSTTIIYISYELYYAHGARVVVVSKSGRVTDLTEIFKSFLFSLFD